MKETDDLEFKLGAAEQVLKQVRDCPHCPACASIAKCYFENMQSLQGYEIVKEKD